MTSPLDPPKLLMEFCGETIEIPPTGSFAVGREADFSIDDNRYLHRRFLELARRDSLWWIANVGTQIAATVSDHTAGVQAWLAPGSVMPIVFGTTVVRFSAGPTSYEFLLELSEPVFSGHFEPSTMSDGTTTIGRVVLTPEQHLLVVALAEAALRDGRSAPTAIPSSQAAAERLGWAITKFNRKLDNVCAKLTKAGVRGLHGSPGALAASRRARLVEYALSVRLVTPSDLDALDAQRIDNEDES